MLTVEQKFQGGAKVYLRNSYLSQTISFLFSMVDHSNLQCNLIESKFNILPFIAFADKKGVFWQVKEAKNLTMYVNY